MKKHLLPLVLLVCGNLVAQTTPQLGIRDKSSQCMALTNARITISPELAYDTATIVIKDGIVVDVGPDVQVPPDASVIDLNGKWIYPGFIDAFTEYGISTRDGDGDRHRQDRIPVYEGNRAGATAWNDAIHSETDWVAFFEPSERDSKEWMKLGFTTVQSGKRDGVLRGRSFVALLGEGLPNDLVLNASGSRGISFERGHSRQWYPGSQMGAIALLRQTFLDTDWYLAARAAFEKNAHQKMPEFNRSIEALADFRSERFLFEANDELEIPRAYTIASEFGLSLTAVGTGSEYARIKEIGELEPTLILPVNYPDKPEISTMDDDLDVSLGGLRHWERAPSNAAVLEENNITFAFTTQALEKRSAFLGKVREAIKRGLSQKTALAALTTVPAQICEVEHLTGTLEKGKIANFFVCEGNIFEEEQTLYSTWIAGKKTEFEPLEQTDFRGTYDLSFMDHKLKLDLAGELGKPRGSIKLDTTEIELKNVSAEFDKLHFAADLDTLDIEGLTRFTGRLKDDALYGRGITARLGEFDWSAIPAEPEEEEDESDSTEAEADSTQAEEADDEETSDDEDQPEELISRLTYPNIAFGYETVPPQEVVLVKNATIWTSEDVGIIENCDMLVMNGKIAEVGPGLNPPSNARVIDATGKHLTPGIIDEHSHTGISGDVNECTHAITAEVRIGDVINPDNINFYRALAGGTTMMRSLHGSCNPIGGQAQILKARWGMSAEDMKFKPAPPSIKFALGENVKLEFFDNDQRRRYPLSRMGVESIIRDVFNAAREYETAWEVYNNLGRREKERTIPPRRDLQLEALVEVLNSRMFVTCHSYVQSEMLMLMRLAEDFGFKVGTFTHVLEGYKIADEMAAHGAAAGSAPDWWAYKFEVYDAIPHNPCILMDRGVVTSINSDSPELGRRLNQGAAKSVMYCGMAPEDALKMVTINPAIQLKADQWVGSIKEGKDADFVIWNGNPLSMYSRPDQTWVDGRKFFDVERDRQMRLEIEDERSRLIQKVLGGDKNGNKEPKKKRRGGPHETGRKSLGSVFISTEGGAHEIR
ncbi:MAG: amidohydrolase family protein [Candidatus Zixiibacteriota bacterium]|nr:MAG: amidohydrolase family protein [candidate division Zixibacteria bacterium]